MQENQIHLLQQPVDMEHALDELKYALILHEMLLERDYNHLKKSQSENESAIWQNEIKKKELKIGSIRLGIKYLEKIDKLISKS